MNAAERRRILFEKITANNQRRIGYLSDDPNPREIVYEVGLWPVQPDEPGY